MTDKELTEEEIASHIAYQELINKQAGVFDLIGPYMAKQPTLRDQIAMAALQGNYQFYNDHDVFDNHDIATACYQMADAMLAAREKAGD